MNVHIPHIQTEYGKYSAKYMSVAHNIVMNLNNVM